MRTERLKRGAEMGEFSKNLILVIAQVLPEGGSFEYNVGFLFISNLVKPQVKEY